MALVSVLFTTTLSKQSHSHAVDVFAIASTAAHFIRHRRRHRPRLLVVISRTLWWVMRTHWNALSLLLLLLTFSRFTNSFAHTQASTAIIAGLGLAALGYGGRILLRQSKVIGEQLNKTIPKIDLGSRYYRGGFDPKINRREAGLILGISPSASKAKVKEAHKRIMLLNHPDRGKSSALSLSHLTISFPYFIAFY